jgi:hypothetical protein
MTNTVVSIDRLSARATARDAENERALRARLPLLLEQAGRRRLPAVLTLDEHEAAHTCVRRLDVRLTLYSDDRDDRVADDWARALAAAVTASVRTTTPSIVHYASDRVALVDLVASVAAGRWDREWAWRQIGLFDGRAAGAGAHSHTTTAASHPDARGLVLGALAKRPELIAGVIDDVVAMVGVATVDRLVGPAGWFDLAVTVAQNMRADVRPNHVGRAARALAIPQGRLTHAFIRTSLRVSRHTRNAWAILALAVDAPGLLRGDHRTAAQATLALRFGAGSEPTDSDDRGGRSTSPQGHPARAGSADGTDRPPVEQPDQVDATGADDGLPAEVLAADPAAAEAGTRDAEEVAAHAADGAADDAEAETDAEDTAAEDADGGDTDPGRPTAYAGLLFLLATANDAGVPSVLLNDPRLSTRSLSWCLHQVGLAVVPVDHDDPAVLALAGVAPRHLADIDATQPDDDEVQAVAESAQAWSAATVQRLREHGAPARDDVDDPTLLTRAVGRQGRVRHEPGWVEVVFDVADTDVLIRRAGLDLDPGWVPWLGTVVRYWYE